MGKEQPTRTFSNHGNKNINKFRVPIAVTPEWKIRAIAKYKEAQNAKKSASRSASAAQALVKRWENSTHRVVNVSKADKILCIQKEREVLEHNAELLGNEIRSLNTIKGRLLWLLNKAILYETEKNHAVRGIKPAGKDTA
jgi:hypothetical protein